MTRKEDLISEIIAIEWRMFTNVSNVGGRAACQDDPETFAIMRSSQSASWSEDTLASYLEDLRDAETCGRNLMTEKYARMMRFTSPLEYAEMENQLPPVDPQLDDLVNKIMAIVIPWEEELVSKYPYLLKRGRPIRSSQDSVRVTSLETYLRGELSTFSPRTLRFHLAHLEDLRAQSVNGSALTLEHTVHSYGFRSLEEANAQLIAASTREESRRE